MRRQAGKVGRCSRLALSDGCGAGIKGRARMKGGRARGNKGWRKARARRQARHAPNVGEPAACWLGGAYNSHAGHRIREAQGAALGQ